MLFAFCVLWLFIALVFGAVISFPNRVRFKTGLALILGSFGIGVGMLVFAIINALALA